MLTVRNGIFLCLFFLICIGTANAQWQIVSGPSGVGFVRVQCFNQIGTNFFAGTLGAGVHISTDNSMNWTAVNTGLTSNNVAALIVNGTNLFAGTDSGVFVSTNNGTNWTAIDNGLTSKNISTLAVIGNNLFAGTGGAGVFLSTDNGANWTAVNNGLTSNFVSSLAVIGTNLFAGTVGFGGSGVYISTNNGTNWNPANSGLTGNVVTTLFASGTNLFSFTSQVFISTDNGTSWSLANTGLPNSFEVCFAVSGSNVFAGAYSNGVYLTTNNGANWNEVNDGFGSSRTIRTLAVLGVDLFAGFYNGSVRRRPLSQMITSVESISNIQPTQFSLDQNYPNPFNPTTKIRFEIPNGGLVELKVYDVLGNEVGVLVNEEKPMGRYEVDFKAANLPSGVYLYKLQAGNFFETKKLMLLK